MTREMLAAFVTLGAFLAVRLPLLHVDPLWGTMEQHEFGLFAMHLASGLVAPGVDYLPQQHQGCTYLFGALAAPIIALGGATVGSLRLASLLLHAAIATIFAGLASRAAGLRAGLVAGLLMVLAPPMMVHFAHKGSTNHDDADLFVGLVLLLLAVRKPTEGRPWLRALGIGAFTGLAGVYMFDGAIRAMAAVAVTAAFVRRPGRREIAAFAVGLALVGGLGWSTGVRIGSSTAVGHAVLATPLLQDAGPSGGLKPTMTSRVADLFDEGLPRTFRGAHTAPLDPEAPRPWHVDWAYLTALLGLILVGWMAGPKRLRGPTEGAGHAFAVLTWSCIAVVGVQIGAVLVSSVDVDANYLAPIWPYLVLLGALAFRPPSSESPRLAAGGLVAATSLVIVLVSLCVPAMWDDLKTVYLSPFGIEPEDSGQSVQQAAFARSLSAGRLANHQLGRRLLEQEDDERLLELAAERPAESLAFARLLGHSAARHLVSTRCSDEAGDVLGGLDRQVKEAGATVFWEGVGEALVRWPHPCDKLPVLSLRERSTPPGGPTDLFAPMFSGSADVEAAGRALFARPGVQADAMLVGMAEGLLFERDAQFEGLQRMFPEGPHRRLFCVAAGHWAYDWLRIVELTDWLGGRGICDMREVAVGWGIGMARDQPPTERIVEPVYAWWWTDPTEEEVAAFQCAWRHERGIVRTLLTDGGPAAEATWRACLPEEEASPAPVAPAAPAAEPTDP